VNPLSPQALREGSKLPRPPESLVPASTIYPAASYTFLANLRTDNSLKQLRSLHLHPGPTSEGSKRASAALYKWKRYWTTALKSISCPNVCTFDKLNLPIDRNIERYINGFGDNDEGSSAVGSSCLGVCHDVPIDIGGVTVKTHIFVVKRAAQDPLLGTP